MLSTREGHYRLGAQGFIGLALSSPYQDARLQEGKQMFSIHHIVCTQSLGTVRYCQLRQEELSWNPLSQMPAKGKLVSKPRIAIRTDRTPFCKDTYWNIWMKWQYVCPRFTSKQDGRAEMSRRLAMSWSFLRLGNKYLETYCTVISTLVHVLNFPIIKVVCFYHSRKLRASS